MYYALLVSDFAQTYGPNRGNPLAGDMPVIPSLRHPLLCLQHWWRRRTGTHH